MTKRVRAGRTSRVLLGWLVAASLLGYLLLPSQVSGNSMMSTNPTFGSPGQGPIPAFGSGFSPFDTITIHWDALNGTVVGTGTSDGAGSFNVDWHVPSNATAGNHSLYGADTHGNSAVAMFNVTGAMITPSTCTSPPPASASPSVVPQGGAVDATAFGFFPNSIVNLQLLGPSPAAP